MATVTRVATCGKDSFSKMLLRRRQSPGLLDMRDNLQCVSDHLPRRAIRDIVQAVCQFNDQPVAAHPRHFAFQVLQLADTGDLCGV